jgi:hypothetical protein
MIAAFWLPFNLLFDLWVYLTPTYEEKWGLLEPPHSRRRPNRSLPYPFLIAALLVTSVFGCALFLLHTLPPPTSRLLLIVTLGFSLWRLLRKKS